MNKVAALAIVFIIALTSCEKRQCYQCVRTVTDSVSATMLGSDTTSICDKTQDEKAAYERENSKTTRLYFGEVAVSATVVETSCK